MLATDASFASGVTRRALRFFVGPNLFRRRRDISHFHQGAHGSPHASALPELKKLGYMTTPVIVIDGSVIVGFDDKKIDQALQG